MATQAQIAASRFSGARSHGPITPEGKLRSSQNSVRHGMLTDTIVLAGESQERFQTLLNALIEEHQPFTESETGLVETMAIARWRLMRAWSLQKVTVEREMSRQPDRTSVVRAAAAFSHLASGRTLELYNRYESSHERQFYRALRELERLKARHSGSEDKLYQPITEAGGTWDTDLPNEPEPLQEAGGPQPCNPPQIEPGPQPEAGSVPNSGQQQPVAVGTHTGAANIHPSTSTASPLCKTAVDDLQLILIRHESAQAGNTPPPPDHTLCTAPKNT